MCHVADHTVRLTQGCSTLLITWPGMSHAIADRFRDVLCCCSQVNAGMFHIVDHMVRHVSCCKRTGSGMFHVLAHMLIQIYSMSLLIGEGMFYVVAHKLIQVCSMSLLTG